MSSLAVETFTLCLSNTLRGFARVAMPSGLTINDVALHEQNGKRWASSPSKPMLGRDGNVLRDQSGKIRYIPIIEFRDNVTRDKWSAAVVRAAEMEHPEAFGARP